MTIRKKKFQALALILVFIMITPLSVSAAGSYTVESGDVLWKIAQQFGLTYQEIAQANNLADPNMIFPGQELVIPDNQPTTASTAPVDTPAYTGPAAATASTPPELLVVTPPAGAMGDKTVVEPTKLFDNVYYVGTKSTGAFVINTSEGIILIDSMNNLDDAKNIIETGIKKLGMDPANIKYVLLTHGHFDHFGGSTYFQDTYGAKVVMSKVDYDFMLTSGSPPNMVVGPKPTTYVEAKDGENLTLGDTVITYVSTPGHTPGCLSLIIPVKDNGISHAVAIWGGTGIPKDLEQNKKYSSSVDYFLKATTAAKVDAEFSVHPFSNNLLGKMETLRSRKEGDPNPVVIGNEAFVKYMQSIKAASEYSIQQKLKQTTATDTQTSVPKNPTTNTTTNNESELFYNLAGFNLPSLTFQPAAPDKGAARFEPVEVFKNVYFIGDNSVSCILFKTDKGIIMWDALECAADMTDILEPDMKKLGLDIADIKICLISHGHYDHFGGARYLQKTYGTKIYMNELDLPAMADHIKSMGASTFGDNGPIIDEYMVDGQKITLGDVTLSLMFTPGHSAGSMSFFVPVTAFDGTKHTLCCWGGTSAPSNAEGMKTYTASIQKFRKYISENKVDSFLSVHPFVDYSTAKCDIVRATRNSDALIRTQDEMDLFCWSLLNYTLTKPKLAANGISYGFLEHDEFIEKYGADSRGFGSKVLNWPYTVYIPEEGNGNGSPYLNQIIRGKIFDNVYFVGTGKDSCVIYDTKDGIVITDAMTSDSDFTKIVKPAMTSFGLDPNRIKAVMITHGDADKVGFASYLQKTYGAKIYMNKIDSKLAPNMKIDVDLVEGSYTFGDFTFDWIYTPGHTAGCMSYLVNVAVDGKAHTAACWGGTSFVYEKKMLEDYCNSIDKFKDLCIKKGADSIVSTHPYFDYSVDKALNLIAGNKNAFILDSGVDLKFVLTCISVSAHYKLNNLEK